MAYDNVVSSVIIETRLTPPIVIDKPLAGGGSPSPFLSLLRPKITIVSPLLSQPKVIAPYGDPGAAWQLSDLLGAITLAAGAAFILRRIL